MQSHRQSSEADGEGSHGGHDGQRAVILGLDASTIGIIYALDGHLDSFPNVFPLSADSHDSWNDNTGGAGKGCHLFFRETRLDPREFGVHKPVADVGLSVDEWQGSIALRHAILIDFIT